MGARRSHGPERTEALARLEDDRLDIRHVGERRDKVLEQPPVRFTPSSTITSPAAPYRSLHGPAGDLPLTDRGLMAARRRGGDVAQERHLAGVEIDLEVAQCVPKVKSGNTDWSPGSSPPAALWPVERPEDLDRTLPAPADARASGIETTRRQKRRHPRSCAEIRWGRRLLGHCSQDALAHEMLARRRRC